MASLIGITLFAGPESAGGGMVGAMLTNSLRQVVGVGVTWAFVTFLTISGLLLLTDRLLLDLGYHFWLSLQDLWFSWEDDATPRR
ncbi:MAG: hypothetical protein R2867_01355 [Caldilineaceae bacterium]